MSSQRGNHKRSAQKHKNADGYKIDKWGTTDKIKQINAAPVGAVCLRCADKIEWKKKYNKYKPLTKPSRCELCKNTTVRHAYHKVCLPCGNDSKICCMCRGKEGEAEIVDMPLSADELIKQKLSDEVMLASMRERDRRTFLRKKEAAEKSARRIAWEAKKAAELEAENLERAALGLPPKSALAPREGMWGASLKAEGEEDGGGAGDGADDGAGAGAASAAAGSADSGAGGALGGDAAAPPAGGSKDTDWGSGLSDSDDDDADADAAAKGAAGGVGAGAG